MRSPSARVLINSVDWYPGTTSQDADGAVQFVYSATPTQLGIPCSAQPGIPDEVIDDQNRLSQETPWRLLFGQLIPAKARDKFIHVDLSGVTHILFAQAQRDDAGRGSTFVVYCIERT